RTSIAPKERSSQAGRVRTVAPPTPHQVETRTNSSAMSASHLARSRVRPVLIHSCSRSRTSCSTLRAVMAAPLRCGYDDCGACPPLVGADHSRPVSSRPCSPSPTDRLAAPPRSRMYWRGFFSSLLDCRKQHVSEFERGVVLNHVAAGKFVKGPP